MMEVSPKNKQIIKDMLRRASNKPDSILKNPAAVELGRLGGLKGGKARANNMTPKQRSESAKHAADVRWGNYKPQLTLEKLYEYEKELEWYIQIKTEELKAVKILIRGKVLYKEDR